MIWRQTTCRQRGDILRFGTAELFGNMTPYEKECLFKIHMQEACREPIDQGAKRVMDALLERHQKKWKTETEARIRDGSLQSWIRTQNAIHEGQPRKNNKQRDWSRIELEGRIR